MMEFLYFPEDKTEYLPAILMLILFTVIAFIAMRFIIKASNNEKKKFEEQFPGAKREEQQIDKSSS
ncbi:hypothetical protein CEY16_09410 [Halalkalibacillus sediminis]|uniref:Uncharacterized protein n=1 Tax=Halalkalibacillus sediminis TaxID=2018042 RepID=A0A2I0QUU6_9BACI|nr:hypothetical protein [Halalkalibacillus sediminis]PKR78122.1 hypothetical protein CEY16_09410 [Halalkalibacillus sediminis]